VQINFEFDEAVPAPNSFKTADPARVALDFMGASSALESNNVDIGIGAVDSVTTAEAGGRTRAVVRLSQLVSYEVRSDGATVQVVMDAPGARSAIDAPEATPETASMQGAPDAQLAGVNRISKVDFRRGEDGAARVILTLSNPGIPVDVHGEGEDVVVDFFSSQVPERLQRTLDVTDFATPVNRIITRQRGSNVRVVIDASGTYEQIAYQTDGTFTIELKPITPAEQERLAEEEFRYTGERLSLNFQDIEVRSVLQLIADFTGLNVVVSDSVGGNITLRLQNVPWDQALDIILQTKGLAKRQVGNVMWVAPAEEIAARERLELEARMAMKDLAPLESEFIRINYAKAADMALLIAGSGDGQSLLSERGSVSIDERTNTLIVRDTAANLEDIRRLVNRLDIPVRQVLIESRIVLANDDFSNELGVRFGYSRNGEIGDMVYGIGGKQPGDVDYGGITGYEVPAGSGNEGLIVDLPVTSPAGSLGLAVGRIGSYLLALELSAMESENRGDVISSPRVVTANQKEAFIKQGVEIPYQEASSSGATSVSFKEAVLGLTVTPQITPDDRVLLDLEVSKDSRGEETDAGPAINTQSVGTQVLVDNGETVVLGGVYERTSRNDITRVPFFGELPLVGWMFRNEVNIDQNSELLIFVTPKILDEQLSLDN
jgi:type IV pilus assembly protein PilQ